MMAYESLQPHYTTHSNGFAFFAFLWMEEPPSCFVLYSQLHSTPTYLTHCIHSPFTLSHGQTILEPSQESDAFMWHACRGTVQHKSKGTKVTYYEWRGTRSPQLNFLFIFGENRNSLPFLFPSTLTRNNTWIQMEWCCDFRRRQQYHPWKQTSPYV